MLTGVDGPAGATEEGGGFDRQPRRTWYDRWAVRWAAVLAGILLLFLSAWREAHALGTQSDGAAMVLESWSMLHGNLLLHGWQVADVSFYTTELPEYMAVELLRGLNPDVVRICSALTFTLLVVLAAAVAYGSKPADKRAAAVRAVIAVAVMIGPTVLGASVLLNDPDHTGTAVPVLLALLILDRGRQRWWIPVLAAVVLGWALVGDSLLLLIGVVPLLIVGGARAFGRLAIRREAFADAWYDLALFGAGLAALIGGTVLSKLIKAAGGFVMSPSTTKSTVPSTALPANLSAVVNNFLGLFSADFFDQRLNHSLAVIAVHVVFACLVAAALFLALRGLARDLLGGDVIAQLLAVAIVMNILAYLFLYPGSGATIREIAPVFGLGGALAGRVLAEPLLRLRLEPLIALGALAAVVVAVPPLLEVKPAQPAALGLSRFLADHHLTSGLAGYWNADSTTLDSNEAITVLPVRYHQGHGLEALYWEVQTPLFDSSDHSANFLVATGPGQGASVTVPEAVATFGPPAQEYHFQGDTIMVWQKNLLDQLGRPPANG